MGFIDSYKQLEKLCREVFDAEKGVSSYIEEMQNLPDGARYVDSWNEDLKKLKHYRWVRNKISHEPECNEENMCGKEDKLWINEFYSRIMSGKDPVSLYRKKKNARIIMNASNEHKVQYTRSDFGNRNIPENRYGKELAGCALTVIAFLLIIVFAFSGIVIL